MEKSKVSLREPNPKDLDGMYDILENSLSQYLTVNKGSSKNNQLIIDKNDVKAYVNNDAYLCKIAQIGSDIAGWMAGSCNNKVLSEHRCSSGEFYIEEIVVASHYRRKGVGSFLLSIIPLDKLKAIVVDTPLINKQAIAFYEHRGFVKASGLSEEFSKNWTRMSKSF